MSDNDEDCERCQAFDELFNTINVLRKIERNVANFNTFVLEKCKKEIESLLHVTETNDDKSA